MDESKIAEKIRPYLTSNIKIVSDYFKAMAKDLGSEIPEHRRQKFLEECGIEFVNGFEVL